MTSALYLLKIMQSMVSMSKYIYNVMLHMRQCVCVGSGEGWWGVYWGGGSDLEVGMMIYGRIWACACVCLCAHGRVCVCVGTMHEIVCVTLCVLRSVLTASSGLARRTRIQLLP